MPTLPSRKKVQTPETDKSPKKSAAPKPSGKMIAHFVLQLATEKNVASIKTSPEVFKPITSPNRAPTEKCQSHHVEKQLTPGISFLMLDQLRTSTNSTHNLCTQGFVRMLRVLSDLAPQYDQLCNKLEMELLVSMNENVCFCPYSFSLVACIAYSLVSLCYLWFYWNPQPCHVQFFAQCVLHIQHSQSCKFFF